MQIIGCPCNVKGRAEEASKSQQEYVAKDTQSF